MNNLVIVAAGKATRMNGFPKALCEIKGVPNIINTIKLGAKKFDNIFVVLSQYGSEKNIAKIESYLTDTKYNVTYILIKSGLGSGDAIYKTIKHIKNYNDNNTIFVWGDTYFVNSSIFDLMLESKSKLRMAPVVVASSFDINPYAWFNVNEDSEIKDTFFKRKCNYTVYKGLHDQSCFMINLDKMEKYFEEYAQLLGWNGMVYIKTENGEMDFLSIFDYLNKVNDPAVIKTVPAFNSYSYNTPEDVEEINNTIKFNTHVKIVKRLN